MYVFTGEPTYWPSDKGKVRDLLDFGISKGIPPHSVQAVAGFDLSSDHSPVLLNMHTRITPQKCPPTLSSKTTDWVTFQNYINENLTLKVPLKTDRDSLDLWNPSMGNCIELKFRDTRAIPVKSATHNNGRSMVCS